MPDDLAALPDQGHAVGRDLEPDVVRGAAGRGVGKVGADNSNLDFSGARPGAKSGDDGRGQQLRCVEGGDEGQAAEPAFDRSAQPLASDYTRWARRT